MEVSIIIHLYIDIPVVINPCFIRVGEIVSKHNLIFPELTYKIRKIIYNAYNQLGNVFQEATYEKALIIGLRREGIAADDQVAFQMFYKSFQVGFYIVDLIKNRGESKKEIQLKENLLFLDLSECVLNILFEVHQTLGPGFLPYIYRRAVCIELGLHQIYFDIIKKIQAKYFDEVIDEKEIRFLVVDNKLGLLVVTVIQITEHLKYRLWSYLNILNLQLGLIVNFNSMPMEFQFIHRKRTGIKDSGDKAPYG